MKYQIEHRGYPGSIVTLDEEMAAAITSLGEDVRNVVMGDEDPDGWVPSSDGTFRARMVGDEVPTTQPGDVEGLS